MSGDANKAAPDAGKAPSPSPEEKPWTPNRAEAVIIEHAYTLRRFGVFDHAKNDPENCTKAKNEMSEALDRALPFAAKPGSRPAPSPIPPEHIEDPRWLTRPELVALREVSRCAAALVECLKDRWQGSGDGDYWDAPEVAVAPLRAALERSTRPAEELKR